MLNKLRNMDGKKAGLFKNTVMLYILQGSTYVFSFITIPYQTRVLGPEVYGVLGVATAVMMYFQLFMDFGFMLSVTEEISLNRDDKPYICKKITSVVCLKLIFAGVSLAIMGGLCTFVDVFAEYKALYFVFLLAYILNSFMPDYIYRGLERMTAVTVRTVIIKCFSCCMIFVLMRTRADYMVVPILLLIGNAGAVIGAYAHLFKGLKFHFAKITKQDLWQDFKRSSMFFSSRIASTVYTATNTVVLGMVDKAGIVTGYYTSADKVASTAKNLLSPVSDSLYPYMVKNKDFKMVKKMLLLFMPVIVVGCTVVGIFAEPLCVFAFGAEYAGTAPILCAFLPVIVAILPSYIFGFPTLGAMGLSKYANYSIVFATVLHIIGMALLFLTDNVTGVSLALMTSVTEWVNMLFRVVVVFKNRNLIRGEK